MLPPSDQVGIESESARQTGKFGTSGTGQWDLRQRGMAALNEAFAPLDRDASLRGLAL